MPPSRFRIPKKKPAPTPEGEPLPLNDTSAPPALPARTLDPHAGLPPAAALPAAPHLPAVPPPPPPPPPVRHTSSLRLPEGWLECAKGGVEATGGVEGKVGRAICGLCAVKTPLSSAFDPVLPPEERWTPAMCLAACGGSSVCLVVDLTATGRYYNGREEVEGRGVRYMKVVVQGRGTPSEAEMAGILDALRQLKPAGTDGSSESRAAEDAPEGAAVEGEPAVTRADGGARAIIHCTHGHNRSGYVLVRALCDVHGYSLADALDAFAAARPPGLWRGEYLRELHGRYGGPMPQTPAPPHWAKEDAEGGGEGGGAVDLFAGAVEGDAEGGTYFQDRRKQWAYRTDLVGLGLLRDMIRVASPLLSAAVAQMHVAGEGERVRREGERIYAQKPNLGANGVTWSQENYAHMGLQIEYLRLKSIQRFTETYAALERAYNSGAFAALEPAAGEAAEPRSAPYRVVSLGGGPGFELLAVRAFFASHLPGVTLELKSLDLEASWRPHAEGLGVGFDVWDVNDGDGLMAAAGADVTRIDLALISYVFYHYMSTEHCYEWLARRLADSSIGAVLIVSRFENLSKQIRALEARSVRVAKLMNQPRYSTKTQDDRQLLFTSADEPAAQPLLAERAVRMTYPNVPHEDQKDARDRSYEQPIAWPGGVEPQPHTRRHGDHSGRERGGRWQRDGAGPPHPQSGGAPSDFAPPSNGHFARPPHAYMPPPSYHHRMPRPFPSQHGHAPPPRGHPFAPPPPPPRGSMPPAGPWRPPPPPGLPPHPPPPPGLPPYPPQGAPPFPPPHPPLDAFGPPAFGPPPPPQAAPPPPPPRPPPPSEPTSSCAVAPPADPSRGTSAWLTSFVRASSAATPDEGPPPADSAAPAAPAAPVAEEARAESEEESRRRRLLSVPETLRDALSRLEPQEVEPALAFFGMSFGGRSGSHQLVLESERVAEGEGEGAMQIVLKLDFDARTWKRVRKRARAAADA